MSAIFILVLFFKIAFVQSSHQAAKSINLCVCNTLLCYTLVSVSVFGIGIAKGHIIGYSILGALLCIVLTLETVGGLFSRPVFMTIQSYKQQQ